MTMLPTTTSLPDLPCSPLAQWLIDNGRTQVWLAARLGISIASMSRIVRGATMPRERLALQIETLTGGVVTVADLARAKIAATPANRAARIRHGKELIERGTSIVTAAAEEV